MKRDNLGDYDIAIEKVGYAAPQRYYGTRILFLMKGTATVSFRGRNYEMTESDILFINRNDNYSIRGDEKNVLLTLSISSHFFVLHYEQYFHYFFECFSKELDSGREAIVSQLRRLLSQMALADANKGEGSQLEIQSCLYQTMLLVTRFFKKDIPYWEGLDTGDERIARIMQSIEQRYAEPLTLTEIAESENLSASYLSRYFKQVTGIGFLQYLNQVRLKHSIEDLLYTSDTLEHIAVRNGFTTAKNFSVVFKSVHDQTPAQYRKEHQHDQLEGIGTTENRAETKSVRESPDILSCLARYLNTSTDPLSVHEEAPVEEREIHIGEETVENLGREEHILFVGELKELLNQTVQQQIQMAHQQIRADFIGIHSLIEGTTLLPERDSGGLGAVSSAYARSDMAIQFAKNNGIPLFLHIKYGEIAENEEIYFEKLDRFLRHTLQVFGSSFLGRWQVCFIATKNAAATAAKLEKVYLRLRNLLKKRSPRMKVGTFLPFPTEPEGVLERENWQQKQTENIDFFSCGTGIYAPSLKDGTEGTSREDVLVEVQELRQYLNQQDQYQPLYVLNWEISGRKPVDAERKVFSGASILKTVLKLGKEVKGISFWLSTELHEKAGGITGAVSGGTELYHYYSGKKTAYYTMRFKESLYGDVIAHGEDYIMTQNEEGYQLMLFNERTIPVQNPTEEFFMRDWIKELHVRLVGLESGEYQVRILQFNRENGSLYGRTEHINSKYGIDQETMGFLFQSSGPTIEIRDEFIRDDWSFYDYLDVNAIHFIEFRRALE